ncbi:cinnamycin family lantibiotic [Kutzneria sp. CA-103260]|uniref:cinnamycin family lantibiotic n=1 Tax=Kutzneria sp. CA-103260 TaxID=2802641 RepID=UPI001BAA5B91|nr:cinnamycin family lantibiotic [Kutzneria sp. CA-103260]QUQ63719.1 Lantibiotic cinnamycin [Kutzneria sp. CA-103260]
MSSTIAQQAAVDADFRNALIENPAAFGVSATDLPAPVEQTDQDSLDYWAEGVASVELYACVQSCSWGPFTAVCDGNTK